MEISFAPDVEAKLSLLASEQGLNTDAFVKQLVERTLSTMSGLFEK